MFDEKSRYYEQEPYEVIDSRGRRVQVTPVPPPPLQVFVGYHLLQQGQRIDHLAAKYTDNPAGYWRIAEMNDGMLPESLTEKQEIAIPVKA